jgi:hypothetical protein
MEFHRRNGLCFKCDEKWSQNHTCPAKISLHVIEELLDALTEVDSTDDSPDADESEEVIAVLSPDASTVLKKRRTMKLCGRIGKHEVLILVDLGSVGTFVSDRLVAQLHL